MPEIRDARRVRNRIGGSGVVMFGGTLFNTEDYNPDLQGQNGTAIYEQMRRSDPDVSSGLAKITMPLLSAKWEVMPADEDSEEEKQIAEFCEKWVMGRGRLDPFAMSWQDFLRHAFLMLSDGFSAFEKVWGVDEDGRQVYAQLGPILPKSVWEFQFKTDGSGALDYMRQRVWTADRGYIQADIPAEKLALFVFGREGDNLWGWPLLRSAYKPWFHKHQLEVIDGIRHERHGVGFAVIKVPNGASTAQKQEAEKVAREMRVHERQGVVIEEDFDLQILYPTGTGSDIVGSLNFYRSQILQVLLSEFMEHGTANVGSKALVTEKVDLMMLALQGLANQIEEVVNGQLIVPLVYRNFGMREKWPALKCEDLDKMGGTELAEILSKLAGANLIHPRAELEQHFLESLQLPTMSPEEFERQQQADEAALEQRINPPDPMAGNVGTPGQKPTPAPKPTEKRAADTVDTEAVPGLFHRDPFPHEGHMDFKDIAKFMDDEPKRVWHRVVEPFRSRQIASLAAEAASAPDVALSRGRLGDSIEQRMGRATSNERRMASELFGALLKSYQRGRADVAAELNRQRVGKAEDSDEDEFEPTAATPAQERWIRALADAFVTGATIALIAEAIRASLQARQADLPKETIERRVARDLEEMSVPRQQAILEGQIIRSYTTGRVEQAKEFAGDITTYRYTAILDKGTCEPCASRDGAEHSGDDPNYRTPSPFCDWPDNCRCFDVYVLKPRELEVAA